jgi:hypothetical protein
MTRRTRAASTFCAIQLGVASLAVAGPASAAEPGPLPHCIYRVETGQSTCYATYEEVTKALSQGLVTDLTNPATVTEADVRRLAAASTRSGAHADAAPLASYVLSIWYSDAGWKGATNTVTAGGMCDGAAGLDFSTPVMPSGWNDRISSYHSYSNCETMLWRDGNLTGPTYGPFANATLGASSMNDKASSVSYH